MTFTPRRYQDSAVNEIAKAFAHGATAPCLVLPVGGGKTKTALFYTLAREPSARVVWIAPRVALLDQTWAAAGEVLPSRDRLTVTTVQKLLASPAAWPAADLLIVDEAHAIYGTPEYQTVAAHYGRRLGLTATPTRPNGIALGPLCDRLIVGPSHRALQRLGVLPPVRTMLPEKRRATEAWGPLDFYRTHCAEERAIVFARSVAHACDLRDRFAAAGVRAGVATAENGEDLQRHRAGQLDVLVSVYMVSIGYDDPTVSTAILARPFGSATSYIQACGRARGQGAARVTIGDLYGAAHEWGLPDEDRTYSLDGPKPIRTADARAPVVPCPGCGVGFRATVWSRGGVCAACAGPLPTIPTPAEKRRAAMAERRTIETMDAKRTFLAKMAAICRHKGIHPGVAVGSYRKRYGVNPPVEWRQAMGLPLH